MAFKPLLCIGNSVCKCVLTTVQFKPKLHTTEVYKQIRSFKKLKNTEKISETTFPHDYIEKGPVNLSKLLKPFGFTVIFSGTTYVVATIWEYERIREKAYRVINYYKQFGIRKTGWRREAEIWWKNLSEGEKVFVPICFLNALVFLAWRVPAFQKTMVQYFCANLASRTTCWPMLLSTFSHYSFLHLAANMYVLHSFCSLTVSSLGKEQFMALYLISGVVSNFSSYLYKSAFSIRNPSLGASGAVMGVLGYVCTQFPDTYLTIIFLPMIQFTAGMAVPAIMGLDILGCILRWQYFDHAAHLGGLFFGIFWQKWGNAYLWQKREPVLTFWHELRGPPKSN